MLINHRKIISLILFLLLVYPYLFNIQEINALKYSNNWSLSNVDASFIGEYSFGMLGTSLAGARDINGDGFDDFLVNDKNKTYLIYGKDTGWNLGENLSKANTTFNGSTKGVGVGDINGDGYDDLLIGNHTRVSLFFGNNISWNNVFNLSDGDVRFYFEDVYSKNILNFGGVGDVNDDGFQDILISIKIENENYSEKLFLFLGKGFGWENHVNISQIEVSFIGESVGDGAGTSIADVGDVNNDGIDDILIGSPFNDKGGNNAGQTYLFFGRTTGWGMNVSLSNSNISFIGEESADYSGISVDGTGDVNGDGIDDFIIGAEGNSEYGGAKGQIYIIFGRTSEWESCFDLGQSDASYIGEELHDWAGHSVAGLGDVNGDNLNDIIIGAYRADGAGSEEDSGKSYLILGSINNWQLDYSLSNADVIFIGIEGDISGWAVSGVGDVNGDGFNDLLIGSPRNDDGGINGGQIYLIFPDSNSGPISVFSLNIYSDPDYSQLILNADVGQTVYIEMKGVDGNISRKDIALVGIKDERMTSISLIKLFETDLNSGVYRNKLFISKRICSNCIKPHFQNNTDSFLFIYSMNDENIFNNLGLNNIDLIPKNQNITIREDEKLSVNYLSSVEKIENWIFSTNTKWLSWNFSEKLVQGIPSNSHVGSYWIYVKLYDFTYGPGFFDEINSSVLVKNVLPEIITNDITISIEDTLYFNDYDSTDDNQGEISWYLFTNATWLVINNTNGILSGLPKNEDVGFSLVNISVHDGNDGWAYSNFTLNVRNVNDPPIITTEDILLTYEDMVYKIQYNVIDIDVDDNTFKWKLNTNASWLNISTNTGLLFGTPENKDIGFYYVNISVKDPANATDFHNFSLEVINVNDSPEFASMPVLEATVDSNYYYDVNATDIDVGDILKYSLVKAPEGLIIDTFSGQITWIPIQGQEGQQEVIVKVTDLNVTVIQTYVITVHPHIVVTINEPAQGQRIGGSLLASGSVQGPENVLVEVDIDGEGWKEVDGNRSWSYNISTWDLSNGNHTINVRATWGKYQSEEASVTFLIDNPKETVIDNGWMMWIVILLLFMMALALLARGMRGEKRS